MAINNNSKKARIARARHAAAQRKTRTAPVAPPPARRSTRRSRRAIPEDSDGSHSEGPEESSHHQSRPPTPEPEGPNPVVPDIETLRATRDALQAQATLAARQGEKSAEVRQLEEEIAKLRSSLTSSVSGQVEGGGYLGNTDARKYLEAVNQLHNN